MKKIGIIGLSVATLLLLTSPAGAISVTDNFTKTGFDIDYGLTWGALGATTPGYYDASLTINSSASTTTDTWTASAFLFKFFGGSNPSDIQNVSGGWTITDGNTNSSFGWAVDGTSGTAFSRNDGFSGFYATGGAYSGVLIGSSPATVISFQFADQGGASINSVEMPFKVGYWSTNAPGEGFGQLSTNLSVPEPGTLLLLGSGLVGLIGFGRRRVST